MAAAAQPSAHGGCGCGRSSGRLCSRGGDGGHCAETVGSCAHAAGRCGGAGLARWAEAWGGGLGRRLRLGGRRGDDTTGGARLARKGRASFSPAVPTTRSWTSKPGTASSTNISQLPRRMRYASWPSSPWRMRKSPGCATPTCAAPTRHDQISIQRTWLSRRRSDRCDKTRSVEIQSGAVQSDSMRTRRRTRHPHVHIRRAASRCAERGRPVLDEACSRGLHLRWPPLGNPIGSVPARAEARAMGKGEPDTLEGGGASLPPSRGAWPARQMPRRPRERTPIGSAE